MDMMHQTQIYQQQQQQNSCSLPSSAALTVNPLLLRFLNPQFGISILQQPPLLYQQQQQQQQQQLREQRIYNHTESVSSVSPVPSSFVMNTDHHFRVENRNDIPTFESSDLPRLFTPSPAGPQRQQYHNHHAHALSLEKHFWRSQHHSCSAVTSDLCSAISPDPIVSQHKVTGKETGSSGLVRVQSQLPSIQKAIRRRLHSMTRGSRLVPRCLPSIVIQSGTGTGTETGTTSSSKSDTVNSTRHQLQKEWTPGSVVSMRIPENISCSRKSNSTRAKNISAGVESIQNQHQVYLWIHSLLGEGAFASVVAVTLADSHIDNADENSCSYACKYIKDQIYQKAGTIQTNSDTSENETKNCRAYIQAQSQLAYEAHLLGCLHHPNIIQSMGFFPTPERSVLLTELLDETLAQKLSRWRGSTNIDSLNLGDQKLSICHQLAESLEYVHSHNIAYRDLKPENVGFVGSTLKLFDFGLSREMISPKNSCSDENNATQRETSGVLPSLSSNSSHSNSSQSYSSSCSSTSPTPLSDQHRLLRGRIGTMRYMAPEVCLEEAYDFDCDIYSYSVLCWEIWTHKTPYSILTPTSYRELVCLQDCRPPQIEVEIAKLQQQQIVFGRRISVFPLPKAMAALLGRGWVRDPKSRIRWREIRQELVQQMQKNHNTKLL